MEEENNDLISAIRKTPFYEESDSTNEVPTAPTQEADGKSESEPNNASDEPENPTPPEEGTSGEGQENGDDQPGDDDPEVEVTVDGKAEKVKLSELKNSYMRQADYTRKTQDLADARRNLEQRKSEQDEAYDRLSKVLKDSTDKLQELEQTAPSVKLRAELDAVDVAALTPEQLQEYQRAEAIYAQMVRREAAERADYEKVRADAAKELKARDDARMSAEFEVLKTQLPELSTREGSMKLGQDMTAYMTEVYGPERGKAILSSIRTKEDFLTTYYAMKGYKLSKTDVKADAEEKAKAFKTGSQTNSQTIKPQKSVRDSILTKVHSKGDRSEISDEDLIAYLSN